MWTIVFERVKKIATNTGANRFAITTVTTHEAVTDQTWLSAELPAHAAKQFKSKHGRYIVAPVPQVAS
jgi:hypothetical protein